MSFHASDIVELIETCLDAHMQTCDNAASPPDPLVPHLKTGGQATRIASTFQRGDMLFIELENGDQFTATLSKAP